MVHIITSANRHLYGPEIEDMLRLRYRVAVEELNWSLPFDPKGIDRDDFDQADTIYFLDYSPSGELIATARLNPTTSPHLMSEVFEDLCNFTGVPVGEDIYEYSRFLVQKRGVPRRVNLAAQARISIAVVEYCLAAGIKHLSWVSYKRSYPLALRMWVSRPLGIPKFFEEDNAEYIAAISDMTEESLSKTRNLAKIHSPVSQMTVPLDVVPETALKKANQ